MDDLFTFAAKNPPVTDGPEGIPSEVSSLFERLALEVAKKHARYSADAILHRIRWHFNIERGDGDFKCNDHWTSQLSRWFLARHAHLKDTKFFETRERRKEREAEAA